MSKQEKISMPSSMGGLVRYFDESKSKVTLSPVVVIVICVLVIVLGIALNALF